MIRYHKTQINEQEADLIPSLHFIHLHQTLSHLKLGHHGSMKRCTMQGIDVSIVCVYIFILYSVFRLGREEREERPSLALVSESRVMEAAQAAAPMLGSGAAQAVASGVVSLTSGVSVSVGPSQSAELPSTEQPIQFTVEFRRAMSSSHTCPPRVTCGCDPPSGVTLTAVVIVWLMIVSMR